MVAGRRRTARPRAPGRLRRSAGWALGSLPTGPCAARSCTTSTRTSASPNRMRSTMPGVHGRTRRSRRSTRRGSACISVSPLRRCASPSTCSPRVRPRSRRALRAHRRQRQSREPTSAAIAAGEPRLLSGGRVRARLRPGFISAVIDATGTELLLDLAHLQVTASWFGADPFEMLDAFPLNRALEVHISSPRPLAGEAQFDDVHDVLTDMDIALLRHLMERGQPRAHSSSSTGETRNCCGNNCCCWRVRSGASGAELGAKWPSGPTGSSETAYQAIPLLRNRYRKYTVHIYAVVRDGLMPSVRY